MKILNSGDILETIEMLTAENLDVRTVTMGISLLDCIDPDGKKACEKIYNKITRLAGNLVPVVNKISADYGIPIVNKRISVTPIAMLLGAAPDADPVWFAKTLDAAAKAVGVNFIGGYGALVHKGFSAGDVRLIESIPRALAETDLVCSSVNIGSTKSGINMDAVGLMGRVVRQTAELTKDNMCMGDAKLVVFCNAPEDNPLWPVLSTALESRTARSMSAFPAPVRCAPLWPSCPRMPRWIRWQSLSSARRSRSPVWASWWPTWPANSWVCPRASLICPWHRPRLLAIVLPTFWKKWVWKAAAAAAPPPALPC